MNKEFIPYEQALDLNKLGYDELCYALVTESNEYHGFDLDQADIWELESDNEVRKYNDEDCIPAPLYQQAFRWFDDNTDYIGFIIPSTEEFGFTYEIHNGFDINVNEEEAYPFRHQAELACLKKLIEIVKNK